MQNDYSTLQNEAPHSEVVQQAVAEHYQLIRKFWGTSNFDDPQAEAYAGLGALYVNDERFTQIDGQAQPEFAAFLSKAMTYYAEHSLTKKE